MTDLRNNHRSRMLGFLPLILGLLCSCSHSSPEASPALRSVRVRLDWTPWAPHAAFYAAAAKSQGFFESEGLRVQLYVPPDPETTIKLVAAGQDDLGISYMTDPLLAREQGFKVTSVAALVPHPLNCIMTLKASGLDDPRKLKNAVFGTSGAASDEAFLGSVLAHNGIAKGQYKLINLGFNLAQALKSRQVQAIVGAYWPWEGIKLEQEGEPVNVFEFQRYGVPNYYELVIVARDSVVADRPAWLQGFFRALKKGQQFVRDHPDDAVRLLRASSPDLTEKFLKASLEKVLPLMDFSGGTFHQDPSVWQNMVDFMRGNGLLKSPVEASRAFTNAFLE